MGCCGACHNTGFRFSIKNGAAGNYLNTTKCHCRSLKEAAEKISAQVAESLIPARYSDATIASWRNMGRNHDEVKLNQDSVHLLTKYVSKIKEMREKGIGIFLCGPNGVGKTYLTCAVGIAALRAGMTVKFYTMRDIVGICVDGWFNQESKKIVSDIEKSDFLIIDDVDKVYKTKTHIEVSMLDGLFRSRVQANLPMLVSSNKVVTQLADTYGASVVSMFKEHCAECVITGSDYRERIAESVRDDILR